MTAFSLGFLAAALAFVRAGLQEPPHYFWVPETDGPPVSVDGVFAPGEWDGALRISESGDEDGAGDIYLRRDRDYVFIGVSCSSRDLPMADLYLRPQGLQTRHLHISSYLAERVVPESPLEETWLDTDLRTDWTANTVAWNTGIRDSLAARGIYGREMLQQAIHPFDGLEIRIRRSQFESSIWLLRIQVTSFGDPGASLTLPPQAEPRDQARWLSLNLGDPLPGGPGRGSGVDPGTDQDSTAPPNRR